MSSDRLSPDNPGGSGSFSQGSSNDVLERKIDEATRNLIEVNKRGVRSIRRNLTAITEIQKREIAALQTDVGDVKEEVKKIFMLLNGDQNAPGIIGKLVLNEERTRVNTKWVYGAITGLIGLLFAVIAEAIHIITSGNK